MKEFEIVVGDAPEPAVALNLTGDTAHVAELTFVGSLSERIQAACRTTRMVGYITKPEEKTLMSALEHRRRQLVMVLARNAAVASMPREQTREYELEQRLEILEKSIRDNIDADLLSEGDDINAYVDALEAVNARLMELESVSIEHRTASLRKDEEIAQLRQRLQDSETMATDRAQSTLTVHQAAQLDNALAMLKEAEATRPDAANAGQDFGAVIDRIHELLGGVHLHLQAVYGKAAL